jgi:Uri superfamily endonuclease
VAQIGSIRAMALSVTRLPSSPGTYVLAAFLRSEKRIMVGRLGAIRFQPGAYAYVGSAFGPGGLAARLSRHLGTPRQRHWHIDYLLAHAGVEIIWMRDGPRMEHRWADILGSAGVGGVAVCGFGASDCACRSHLFRFDGLPSPGALGKALGARWIWRRPAVRNR